MTGPTHKQFSVAFVFIAAIVLFEKGVFTALLTTNQPNYWLALILMMPIAKVGAKFPDWDQDWQYINERSVASFIVNKLIHLTGGRHRSWQTHSLDITLWLCVASLTVPDMLISKGVVSSVNGKFLYIITVAFMAGWLSHAYSDMLNGVGIRIFFWNRKTIAFVPKKFLGIHFKTGEAWESWNYFIIRRINIVLGVITLIYPFARQQILQYVDMLINNIWR